jgi:hypothetical protein
MFVATNHLLRRAIQSGVSVRKTTCSCPSPTNAHAEGLSDVAREVKNAAARAKYRFDRSGISCPVIEEKVTRAVSESRSLFYYVNKHLKATK